MLAPACPGPAGGTCVGPLQNRRLDGAPGFSGIDGGITCSGARRAGPAETAEPVEGGPRRTHPAGADARTMTGLFPASTDPNMIG